MVVADGVGLTLVLVGCSTMAPVAKAPPPPMPATPVEAMTAQPGPSYVWIPGHHEWRTAERTYVWVPGHWETRSDGSVWVESHWRRS